MTPGARKAMQLFGLGSRFGVALLALALCGLVHAQFNLDFEDGAHLDRRKELEGDLQEWKTSEQHDTATLSRREELDSSNTPGAPSPSTPPRPPHTDLPPVNTIGQETPNQKNLKWYLIGGIAGGGFLLILVILIVLICLCVHHDPDKEKSSTKAADEKDVDESKKEKPKKQPKEKEKAKPKAHPKDDDYQSFNDVPLEKLSPAVRAALMEAQKTARKSARLTARTTDNDEAPASPSGNTGSASQPDTTRSDTALLRQGEVEAPKPTSPDATAALLALSSPRTPNSARNSSIINPHEVAPPRQMPLSPISDTEESSSSEPDSGSSSSESRSESSESESDESSSHENTTSSSDTDRSSSISTSGGLAPAVALYDPHAVDDEGFDDW